MLFQDKKLVKYNQTVLKISVLLVLITIWKQLDNISIIKTIFIFLLRFVIPFGVIVFILYLIVTETSYHILNGLVDKQPFDSLLVFPTSLPIPETIVYCGHFDINEMKLSAPWVPIVISLNYILIFLWVSFFSILFYDPNITSFPTYCFYLISFTTCFIIFLFLTNCFRRKMEHSLYCMSCNLIILFICGIATSSMNNLTHYLHKKGPALYDIAFQIIPEIPIQYAEISDIILVSYILICLARSLFLHPIIRNKIWADFGRISSIMILSKGLMGWWTLLPGPAPHCRPGTPSYAPESIKSIFINQGTMFGHALNCGDLIFSGHTGFLVTMMLLSEELWKTSKPRIRWLWRIFTILTLLLFSIFCLSARKHYSDIISAYWIAFLNYCSFRHSWIPLHSFFPFSHSVTLRTSLSRTDSKADTIIISEENTTSFLHHLSRDHPSSDLFD